MILNARAAAAQLEVKLYNDYPNMECLKRSFRGSMVTSVKIVFPPKLFKTSALNIYVLFLLDESNQSSFVATTFNKNLSTSIKEGLTIDSYNNRRLVEAIATHRDLSQVS